MIEMKQVLRIASLASLLCFLSMAMLSACKPKDPRTGACSAIEWNLQNSAECLANPNMWQEWSNINKSYGADSTDKMGEIGCPVFISKIESYGFRSGDGSILLNYFVQTYGETGGIKYRFKKATGRDFCHVAEEKGWITKYLEINARSALSDKDQK